MCTLGREPKRGLIIILVVVVRSSVGLTYELIEFPRSSVVDKAVRQTTDLLNWCIITLNTICTLIWKEHVVRSVGPSYMFAWLRNQHGDRKSTIVLNTNIGQTDGDTGQ